MDINHSGFLPEFKRKLSTCMNMNVILIYAYLHVYKHIVSNLIRTFHKNIFLKQNLVVFQHVSDVFVVIAHISRTIFRLRCDRIINRLWHNSLASFSISDKTNVLAEEKHWLGICDWLNH